MTERKSVTGTNTELADGNQAASEVSVATMGALRTNTDPQPDDLSPLRVVPRAPQDQQEEKDQARSVESGNLAPLPNAAVTEPDSDTWNWGDWVPCSEHPGAEHDLLCMECHRLESEGYEKANTRPTGGVMDSERTLETGQEPADDAGAMGTNDLPVTERTKP